MLSSIQIPRDTWFHILAGLILFSRATPGTMAFCDWYGFHHGEYTACFAGSDIGYDLIL